MTDKVLLHGQPRASYRSIEEIRGDDPELASYLRIEERELEGAG
jgi:hypothetical protein